MITWRVGFFKRGNRANVSSHRKSAVAWWPTWTTNVPSTPTDAVLPPITSSWPSNPADHQETLVLHRRSRDRTRRSRQGVRPRRGLRAPWAGSRFKSVRRRLGEKTGFASRSRRKFVTDETSCRCRLPRDHRPRPAATHRQGDSPLVAHPSCDISFDDANISRRHAEIKVVLDAYVIF